MKDKQNLVDSENGGDVGLAFKSHNQSFVTLENRIEMVNQLEFRSKFQPGVINYYLAGVQALVSKYSSYISNADELDAELERLDDKLNATQYQQELVSLENGTPASIQLVRFEKKVWKRVRSIFRHICEEFTKHELLPKPTTKDVDEDEF